MTRETVLRWLETRWKLLVLGLAVFLGLQMAGDAQDWYHARFVQPVSDSLVVFRQEAAEAVRYADSLLAENDKGRRRELRLEKRVRYLTSIMPDTLRLDSLRQAAESLYQATDDSLRAAVPVIAAQREVIQQQDSALTVQGKLLATKDTLLARCDTNTLRLTLALDSTRTVLTNPPAKPKPERFLGFLPMPSRRTAFLGGLIVGLLSFRL